MGNTFRKLNISKALIMKGVSLVVVFATLVSAYAAFSMNATLGWFSKNNTVTANGMITQAYQSKFTVTYANVTLKTDANGIVTKEVGTEVTDPNDIITGVKVPGHSVAFDVTVTNIGVYPATLTGFGFDAPGVDEDVPKYEIDSEGNRTAHYLSTELATRLVMASRTNSNNDPAVSGLTLKTGVDDKYLRQKNGVAGQIDYFEWIVDAENEVVLDPGESVTFTIQITFVDAEYDQNIFKNFAEEGKCQRRIFLAYDE